MRNLPLNSNKINYNCSTKLSAPSLGLDIPNKTKKHHNNLGFTILELMVTVAVAVVILSIALPSMGGFIVKMRVDNEISQLNRLVLTARNTAISTEQNVTLCYLDGSNNTCRNNWSGELSVFIDLNANGIYEPPAVIPPIPAPPALPTPYERLIKVKASTSAGDTIAFGQNRITFAPTGLLASGASTFLYCPSSERTLGRALQLSIAGRAAPSSDSNGDGVDEFRTGADVICP